MMFTAYSGSLPLDVPHSSQGNFLLLCPESGNHFLHSSSTLQGLFFFSVSSTDAFKLLK